MKTKVIGSIHQSDSRLTMAYLYVAFIFLLIGATAGLLQTLVRSGKFTLPAGIGYYQLLTLHGVALALILTTYFIIGFIIATQSKTAGEYSNGERKWLWVGYIVITIGTVMSAILILLNEATVLYTFYAPLQAHPGFYIGLTLVIVGSWISGFVVFRRHARWRKEHRGELSPLLSFMSVITMLLWQIATLGVAASVIIQFIPWSLGYTERIDVLISRTLFWYFGHPLVYFWLLPAYMCWYAMIPKIIGGKIFSDALARFAFILLLLFSIPVGFHHQLTEPGIDPAWKFLQVILTFLVVIPSFITAFSILATFERRGRELGATTLYGWLKKMPWKDVRFLAPFVGMLWFALAGTGGIINASHQMNQVVHNTIWVTGHFHLSIGAAVILTFFGITYWLVPSIKGRKLTKKINNLGIVQTIIWSIGMFFMSGSMHWQGLLGAPRRSSYSEYMGNADTEAWGAYQLAQAVGGSILFIGMILMLIVFFNLAFFAPRGEEEFPVGTAADKSEPTPKVFENWKLWIGITFALILFAYTIPFIDMVQNLPPGSKGFRLW